MSLIDLFSTIVPLEQLCPNEPMCNHTSFKIGGPADLLVKATDAGQIAGAMALCRQHGLPCFVMGNGSNLLVSDAGIEGVVIKISEGYDAMAIDENGALYAESGTLLSALAAYALSKSLTGLEFAAGIPGTLGGAVFMNAGAYDGEMRHVVTSVDLLMPDGQTATRSCADMQFAYRSSVAQTCGAVILKTRFSLCQGDPEAIHGKMADFAERRSTKQPLSYPSAGSIFKRPAGHYAGKLIRDSGLAGFAIGGAQVSAKHCGFIINTGGATAKNVIDLIAAIQQTVYDKYGVKLETEVRAIGSGSPPVPIQR